MSTLYEQALECRARGDLGKAIELLGRQVASEPEDQQSRLALGVVSIESGDAQGAVQTLHPVVVAHPHDAQLLKVYGIALRGVARYADAIKVFTRAQQIHPSPDLEQELGITTKLAQTEASTSGQAPLVPQPSPAPLPMYPQATRSLQPSAPSRRQAERSDGSLAASLDTVRDDVSEPQEVRGDLKFAWHRQLRSYRRFWIGVVLIVAGILMKLGNVPSRGEDASKPWSVPRIGDHLDLLWMPVVAVGILVIVSAVISARFTRYRVYDHRIDFERGVLSQKRVPVWLFDITGVSMRRTPLLTLTRTAQIIIEYDAKEARPGRERLVATSGIREMAGFAESLQGDFLRERRAMKKLWI